MPKAIREMIDIVNDHVRLQGENQAPELERARRVIVSLEKPTSKRFIQQTMDEMTGLLDNAALDTRVAWVRDLLDRVSVDGREEHAVATWRTASDDGVKRSDSGSSWLRR